MGLKAGGGSEHKWYAFHLAGLCFSATMRLIPRRRRFEAAMLIARAAIPLVRRTGAFKEQQRGKVDGAREIALHLVLNTLTKNGIEFDPDLTVHGAEELERMLAAGKGVLLISPHTVLSLLMLRFLHDAGHAPVVIAADPQMRISGTNVTAETLQPSPTFLVATRTRLRRGRLVCGMPDRGEPSAGRTIEFATANGQIILAPALLQVAARCRANVMFLRVQVEGRAVVATMTPPPAEAAGSTDALTEAFIEFVRAHVQARRAVDD